MREATDLGIGAAVRRELAGRRIDLSKIKFPVKAGVVTLQGELAFVGINKTADETAIELKFIESSIKQIAGVKELIFELEGWSKNEGGVWESGQTQSTSSGSSSVSTASGDGLYCDDCDMVIRFCPCCGKPLAAAGKSSAKPRRTIPPVKPIIKRKIPTTPLPSTQGKPVESIKPGISSIPAAPVTAPVAPTTEIKPAGIPSSPVAPIKPVITPIKPAEDLSPAAPAEPAVKPPPAPALKPHTQAPTVASPLPKPTSITPEPEPAPAPAPAPISAPLSEPVVAAPAVQDKKPAPDFSNIQSEKQDDITDEMNFDGLNLDIGVPKEPENNKTQIADKVKAKPAAPPAPEPAVPTPDFMKSDALTNDLFGSLIDNLSQSENEDSSEQSETTRLENRSDPGQKSSEEIPDLNLTSLDSFTTSAAEESESEPPMEDISDLLPPMKPVAPAVSAKPVLKQPASEPDPFANIDDTPLPPMKPAIAEPDMFEEDDTPLPPMKPKTPVSKESKDPFAALFSESDMGLGSSSSEGSKDPFASLDLDLDVLEVFPSDDQPALPPVKPGAGAGKKPAAPVDDNPFNIDNIIDLDTPVEEKPKAGKKPAKDPFDLDDFDIGKFKL